MGGAGERDERRDGGGGKRSNEGKRMMFLMLVLERVSEIYRSVFFVLPVSQPKHLHWNIENLLI